jgi:hypothetical protein
MTSEEIVVAIKSLALFFCVGYPIAQGLIGYCAYEDRQTNDRMQQERITRAEENSQLLATHRSKPNADKGKRADSSGGQATYLTNEQRELGKKLIEEAKKAGH